jgi:hypothetical protein
VSGADGVQVDLDALSQLSADLESIRTRMDAAREWTHQFDGLMGASQVEDALHDFASGWRDGRKRIDGNAKALSDMAANSVEAFRSTDQQLADQIGTATAADAGFRPGHGDAAV